MLEPRTLLTTYDVAPGNLIQPVIDAAVSGDTIHIEAGTYVEQLTIDGKDLTLTGDGTGNTIIDTPATLLTSFSVSGNDYKSIVTFLNTSAGNINNLTIDGQSSGNANARFVGLAYRNAGGTADHIAVQNVTSQPKDLSETGVAVFADDDDGTSRTLFLSNSSLSNYQHNGAVLSGANLTVQAQNNSLSGDGPTNRTQQIGIQISFGATGSITGNTVSNDEYIGTAGGLDAAILVTQTSGVVVIDGNAVISCDGGIVSDSNASITRNTLHTTTVGVGMFGPITAGAITNNFIDQASFASIAFDAQLLAPITITGNSITRMAQFGVYNGSAITLDVTGNWWGTSAGPTVATNSSGNALVGPITYSSFLLNGVDSSADPGFQPTAPVVGRYVFYNGSAYDNNDPAANAADDGAMAPDKPALLPGQTASFLNYTSYVNGINGIMVDVLNFAHADQVTAADFAFKMGTSGDPSTWVDAPAPATVLVRPGQGAGGADRVDIVWTNADAVKNQWLQVTILADSNTGLPASDVFYFGNAVGETGNSPTNAQVSAIDELGARFDAADLTGQLSSQALLNVYDFNRDGHVDSTDEGIAGANYTTFLNALPLIGTPPAVVNTAAAQSGVALGAGAARGAFLPAFFPYWGAVSGATDSPGAVVSPAAPPPQGAPSAVPPVVGSGAARGGTSTVSIALVRWPRQGRTARRHSAAAGPVIRGTAGAGAKPGSWKLVDWFLSRRR